MDDPEKNPRRRRALIRLLSFPVCVMTGTLAGFAVGTIAGRGKDSVMPPQLTYAVAGFVLGVILAAVIGTTIDIKNLRD